MASTTEQVNGTIQPPVTTQDKCYWRDKVPRSFKYFLDRLSRSLVVVQPTNGPEFAAVFMETLLAKRTDELGKLPAVSYFDRLKKLVDERGYGGPFIEVPAAESEEATSTCCGSSHLDVKEDQEPDKKIAFCPCQVEEGKELCGLCFPVASTVIVVKPPPKMISSEAQTIDPGKDEGIQVMFGTDEGVQVDCPESPELPQSPVPVDTPRSTSPVCPVHGPIPELLPNRSTPVPPQSPVPVNIPRPTSPVCPVHGPIQEPVPNPSAPQSPIPVNTPRPTSPVCPVHGPIQEPVPNPSAPQSPIPVNTPRPTSPVCPVHGPIQEPVPNPSAPQSPIPVNTPRPTSPVCPVHGPIQEPVPNPSAPQSPIPVNTPRPSSPVCPVHGPIQEPVPNPSAPQSPIPVNTPRPSSPVCPVHGPIQEPVPNPSAPQSPIPVNTPRPSSPVCPVHGPIQEPVPNPSAPQSPIPVNAPRPTTPVCPLHGLIPEPVPNPSAPQSPVPVNTPRPTSPVCPLHGPIQEPLPTALPQKQGIQPKNKPASRPAPQQAENQRNQDEGAEGPDSIDEEDDEYFTLVALTVMEQVYEELKREFSKEPEMVQCPPPQQENTCNSAIHPGDELQEEMIHQDLLEHFDNKKMFPPLGLHQAGNYGHTSTQSKKSMIKPAHVKTQKLYMKKRVSFQPTSSRLLQDDWEKNNSSIQSVQPLFCQVPLRDMTQNLCASQYVMQSPPPVPYHCFHGQILVAPSQRCCHSHFCCMMSPAMGPVIQGSCVHQPLLEPPRYYHQAQGTSRALFPDGNIIPESKLEQKAGRSSDFQRRPEKGREALITATDPEISSTSAGEPLEEDVLPIEPQMSSNVHYSNPPSPPPSPVPYYQARWGPEPSSDPGFFKFFTESNTAAADSLMQSAQKPGKPMCKKGTDDKELPSFSISSWKMPPMFPGTNSFDAPSDNLEKCVGYTQPHDLVSYLHYSFPNQPFSCPHSAFSRGPPCLMPHCSCVTYLLKKLQESQSNPEDSKGGRAPVEQPGKQSYKEYPSRPDSSARTGQTKSAGKPNVTSSKTVKGVHRIERAKSEFIPRTWDSYQNEQSSQRYPLQRFVSDLAHISDNGSDFRDPRPDKIPNRINKSSQRANAPKPQSTDATTQWSDQNIQAEPEEDLGWSMAVEFDSKSNFSQYEASGQSFTQEISTFDQHSSAGKNGRSLKAQAYKQTPQRPVACEKCQEQDTDNKVKSMQTSCPEDKNGTNKSAKKSSTDSSRSSNKSAPEQPVSSRDVMLLCNHCLLSACASVDGVPDNLLTEQTDEVLPKCCCSDPCSPTERQDDSEHFSLPEYTTKGKNSQNNDETSQVAVPSAPEASSAKTLPSINMNVIIQMESNFDSNVFMEQVKQHITDAFGEMRDHQKEIPNPQALSLTWQRYTVQKFQESRGTEISGDILEDMEQPVQQQKDSTDFGNLGSGQQQEKDQAAAGNKTPGNVIEDDKLTPSNNSLGFTPQSTKESPPSTAAQLPKQSDAGDRGEPRTIPPGEMLVQRGYASSLAMLYDY